MLSSFSCPKNPDVESYLHSKAVDNQLRDRSRTYLIVRDDDAALLGYFSLSLKELELCNATISKSQVRRIHGFDRNAQSVPAYLIGQLGKNYSISDNHLNIEIILQEIYGVIEQARHLIGGRTIILECENKSSLVSMYQDQGFKAIETTAEDDQLITMFIVVSN